jgi:serine O-acetyltransferase
MVNDRKNPDPAAIVESILESYKQHGEMAHLEGGNLPSRETIWSIVEELLCLIFPGFLETGELAPDEFVARTSLRVRSVERRLRDEIEKGLRFSSSTKLPEDECRQIAETATRTLLSRIPYVRDILSTDIEAAYDGDPAAQSLEEIIVAYPGVQAIAVYRLAHVLWREKIPLVPRVMTEYAHSRTGIDIHPGATIGKRFFIDHGTGVVIGETCSIGENVRIYQGVTLGARSFAKDEHGRLLRGIKRHPNLEDEVTVYSGATILGDVRIGRGSLVGGNVWLTESVPADTKIVVRPPQQIHIEDGANDYQI